MTDEIQVVRAKKNLNKALDFYETWRFHLARCMRMDSEHLTKRGKQKLVNHYKKLHDLAYKLESASESFDCPFYDHVRKDSKDCVASDCGNCPYELGCNFHLAIQIMIAQLIRSLAAIRSEFAV